MTLAADILHGLEVDALPFDLAELDGMTDDEADAFLLAHQMAENEHLDLLARTMPLAVAPLWVRSQAHIDSLPEWAREGMPDDGPDQLALFVAMLTWTTVVAGGGNRSGKTWAMYCAALCFMLGRDHPMIAAFLALNGVDPSLVPLGPGDVYLVAPSSNHSIKTHRKIVDSMVPPDARKWSRKDSPGESFVQVECPGYATPGRCYFMSVDQNPDKFRGIEGRFVGIDEEPKGEDGRLIFDECQRAVSGEAGRVVIAATAQDGETWMVEMMRDTTRCYSLKLDSLCNYLINKFDGLLKHFRKMTPKELQVKRYGEPVPKESRVYPEFTVGDRDRWGRCHVCEPFDIPEDWPRFMGVDYGVRDPTAIVWAAVGDDGTIYVYREHLEAERTWEEQAEMAHRLMGHEVDEHGEWHDADGDVIEFAWGDGAEPAGILAFALTGLPIAKADKSLSPGLNAVRDRLRVHADERSRLKVFSTCPITIEWMQDYRWNERLNRAAPIKKDDHLLDALRYLVMGVSKLYM